MNAESTKAIDAAVDKAFPKDYTPAIPPKYTVVSTDLECDHAYDAGFDTGREQGYHAALDFIRDAVNNLRTYSPEEFDRIFDEAEEVINE